jgi:hypothetical protein
MSCLRCSFIRIVGCGGYFYSLFEVSNQKEKRSEEMLRHDEVPFVVGVALDFSQASSALAIQLSLASS